MTASRAASIGLSAPRPAWYKRPYRIVQTNLREIDVKEDPREIARAIKAFGGDVIVSNIGGIVAFYPTQLKLQHTNPKLTGDFAGAMIEAARAEGLVFVGRFDLSKSTAAAYRAHPEWFMLNRDGTPREYAGTYQACPNGGWAREYGPLILREAGSRYAMDSAFFNMTGFPATDYSNVAHGICVCDNCRRRFRALYKRELPTVDGFGDPGWIDYLEFQDRTSEEVLELNNATLRKVRPNTPILGYFRYREVGRGEVQRRVSRTAPEWQYQSGEQSRSAQARNPGKPFSSTSAAHIDYPWRQVTETAAYHELRFAQQLATGAQLDLYLMGTLADQDDTRYLASVSRLFQWYGTAADAYTGLRPGARVALYDSEKNGRFGGGTRSAKRAVGAFRGAYSALAQARLSFWFVNDGRIEDGTTRLTAVDYDVLVMPHVGLLSDAEAACIDEFVAGGGLLITTGETGAYGPRGQVRAANALRSSPAISFGTPVDAQGWTFDAARASIDLGGARIAVDAEYFPVAAREGATNLLPLAPDQRFGPPEFSYAIPGRAARAEPGMLVRSFGKGHAVHIPWLPDWLFYRDGLADHAAIFAALIARYAPPAEVQLVGAGPVELMLHRQPLTGRRLVHVVNYAGQRNGLYDPPPAIHGLKLGIRGGAREGRALRAGISLRGTDAGGHTWFDLPPVETFEALLIA
ncbi:alpha-amylase family protein [Sphingomonas profundi]|uniref:alpha-amylase family protein n=1 Tax=Alterirhizorhabdus profundi TaxID=2681549 RepID=UPI0018D0133B|nr:alpha-amylase family protein [Sphingomonas profundi]